jgi:hypothetical protein
MMRWLAIPVCMLFAYLLFDRQDSGRKMERLILSHIHEGDPIEDVEKTLDSLGWPHSRYPHPMALDDFPQAWLRIKGRPIDYGIIPYGEGPGVGFTIAFGTDGKVLRPNGIRITIHRTVWP